MKKFIKKIYDFLFDPCTACAIWFFLAITFLTWFILATISLSGSYYNKVILCVTSLFFFREGVVGLRKIFTIIAMNHTNFNPGSINTGKNTKTNETEKLVSVNEKEYYTKYLPKKGGLFRVVKYKGIPAGTEVEIEMYLCTKEVKKGDVIVVTHPQVLNKFQEEVIEEVVIEGLIITTSNIPVKAENYHKIVGVLKKDLSKVLPENAIFKSVDPSFFIETKTEENESSNREGFNTDLQVGKEEKQKLES
jgi:hypothetical protein